MVLATLLIISGFLRFASGPVLALATDQGKLGQEDSPTQKTAMAPDRSMDLWIEELTNRDDALVKAEAELAREQEELALAKELIAQQLAALEEAQETLRKNLHTAGETAAGDITQLTAMYQRMKPKEAAAIFEKMDPQFAAGFLARMKPDAAAAIMAGLQPSTAYTFSAILAGRNAALADQSPE
ncbi:MAG: hypothetical protein OIF40_06910 [Mangrovicoccus sp.]|nr:hypothetical protein [Mangrovicoccus sp.]